MKVKYKSILSIVLVLITIITFAGCNKNQQTISDEDLQMLREMKEELEAEKEQQKKEIEDVKVEEPENSVNSDEKETETEEKEANNFSEIYLTSLETLDYSERDNMNVFYNGIACVSASGGRYLINKEGIVTCDVNKLTAGTLKDIHIVPVGYTGLWVAYDSARKFIVFDSDGNEKYKNDDENSKFLGASEDGNIFYAKLESGFDESKVPIIKMDSTLGESEVAIYVDSEGNTVSSLNEIDKKPKQACIFHKIDDGVYYGDKIGFVNENTKTAYGHRKLFYMGINSKNAHVFVGNELDAAYECMPVSSDLKNAKCGNDIDDIIYNESNQFWDDFITGLRVDNGYVGFNLFENVVYSMDGNKITLPVTINEGTSFTQYKNDRIGVGCYGQDDYPYLIVVDGQGNRVCEPIQTEYILYDIANIDGFILGIGNELIGVTHDGNVIGIEDGFPIDDNYRSDLMKIAEGFIWHDDSKSFVSYDGKTVISKIKLAK